MGSATRSFEPGRTDSAKGEDDVVARETGRRVHHRVRRVSDREVDAHCALYRLSGGDLERPVELASFRRLGREHVSEIAGRSQDAGVDVEQKVTQAACFSCSEPERSRSDTFDDRLRRQGGGP